MSLFLMVMLSLLSNLAKENRTGPVRCCCCHRSSGIIRYGYYERYLFSSGETIKVQRYLCRNRDCGCLTFSVLPHPFVPYIRFPHSFLLVLLSACESGAGNFSSLARQIGRSCRTVKRAVALARKIRRWLAPFMAGPTGALSASRGAVDGFHPWFSWAFVPGRFGHHSNHTN